MSRRCSHLDPKLVRYAENKRRDEIRIGFGRALRKWLDEAGMSARALARQIGVAQAATASQWMHGRALPTAAHLAVMVRLGFRPPTESISLIKASSDTQVLPLARRSR